MAAELFPVDVGNNLNLQLLFTAQHSHQLPPQIRILFTSISYHHSNEIITLTIDIQNADVIHLKCIPTKHNHHLQDALCTIFIGNSKTPALRNTVTSTGTFSNNYINDVAIPIYIPTFTEFVNETFTHLLLTCVTTPSQFTIDSSGSDDELNHTSTTYFKIILVRENHT